MKMVCLVSMLILTGCGGSSLPNGQTTPPPSSDTQIPLNYESPQILLVNHAAKIVPELDNVGGDPVHIEPPLPAGLVFDAATGIISGIPTEVTAATVYTLSINSELDGKGSTTIVIEVGDGPFLYSSPIAARWGAPMTPEKPRGTSNLTNFSVAPPLPAGLSLDPTTGVLSGTPTAAQPPAYYEISATDSSIQKVFGINIGVVDPNASLLIDVPNGSTLGCAYSGAFVGSFLSQDQPSDDGLIEIAFAPDGQSQARIHDFGAGATYDSDGTGGLNANLDGSFQFNFASTDSVSLNGSFLGEKYLSGTLTKSGVATPFLAARIGGSPIASVRYTALISSFEVEFAALDRTTNRGSAIGYIPQTSNGEGLYRWNLQIPITVQFDAATSAISWQAPGISETGSDLPPTGLNFTLGAVYDDSLYLKFTGCQLN